VSPVEVAGVRELVRHVPEKQRLFLPILFYDSAKRRIAVILQPLPNRQGIIENAEQPSRFAQCAVSFYLGRCFAIGPERLDHLKIMADHFGKLAWIVHIYPQPILKPGRPRRNRFTAARKPER